MKPFFTPLIIMLAILFLHCSLFEGRTSVSMNNGTNGSNGDSNSNNGSVFDIEEVDLTTLETAAEGNVSPGTNMFVGVGYRVMQNTKGLVQKSNDGITWEEVADLPVALNGLAYGHGRIVLAGDQLFVSSDGQSFRAIQSAKNSELPYAFNAVAFGDGLFVAVGSTSSIAFSKDGETWVRYAGDQLHPEIIPGHQHLYGVYYLDGKFYVLGNGNTIIRFAKDRSKGLIKEKADFLGALTSHLEDMAYGNNILLAVGTTDDYMSSDMGETWTAVTPWHQYFGVEYANDLFVAACGYGELYTSPTGQSNSWEEILSTRGIFYDVAYGNGKFVATGKMGDVYYSVDGVNWESTEYANGESHTIKRVIYIP